MINREYLTDREKAAHSLVVYRELCPLAQAHIRYVGSVWRAVHDRHLYPEDNLMVQTCRWYFSQVLRFYPMMEFLWQNEDDDLPETCYRVRNTLQNHLDLEVLPALDAIIDAVDQNLGLDN